MILKEHFPDGIRGKNRFSAKTMRNGITL